MKEIIGFIKAYYHEANKPALICCTVFMAIFVWLNYQHLLEYRLISHSRLPLPDFMGHFLIYFIAFLIPYLVFSFRQIKSAIEDPGFVTCLIIGPLIFACKVGMDSYINISGNNQWDTYWNSIIYWPMRLMVLVALLGISKLLFHKEENFYGLSSKKFNIRPYLLMLLIMIPLIVAASTQPDFLASYPKLKVASLPADADPVWFYKSLFELSYGTDFFSVEIFFRGFLVIGFMKWVGKEAILPMACFYCTIHFGKPLGECISSYFGGILLGIVSYNTRSIYGGLIVHLGIAWLMEVGGHIGNTVK